jgi:hypothetical protein
MSTWGAIRLSLGILLAVLGTLLLVTAVPSALAAAGIRSTVGTTGVVTQSVGTLRAAPSDVAVIVDGVSARLVAPSPPEWVTGALALVGTDSSSLAEDLGDVVLVASPMSESAFMGIAPVEAVNDYLDGTPYSVAVSEAGEPDRGGLADPPGQPDRGGLADPPGQWSSVSVPGQGAPPPPAGQQLWLAAAEGPAPELPADSLEGVTLVLMRPDAAPGPEASLRLEYRVPGAPTALESAAVGAVGGSVGGLLLILLGGALVVGRRKGRLSDGT